MNQANPDNPASKVKNPRRIRVQKLLPSTSTLKELLHPCLSCYHIILKCMLKCWISFKNWYWKFWYGIFPLKAAYPKGLLGSSSTPCSSSIFRFNFNNISDKQYKRGFSNQKKNSFFKHCQAISLLLDGYNVLLYYIAKQSLNNSRF